MTSVNQNVMFFNCLENNPNIAATRKVINHSRNIDSPNMSDLEDLEVELQRVTYDNCIVTRRSDSESSCTSILSLQGCEPVGASQQSENDSSDIEVTCEQVEEADLNAEDSFFFMLGTVHRIEKYLNNMQEGNHKEWLMTHIHMIKTVLTKNLKLFNKNGLKINKTVSTKTSKTKKTARKNKRKEDIKVMVQPKTKIQDKCRDVLKLHEANTPNRCKTTEARAGMRRSQRLHQLNQDRELVYCDRMSYISLKLPSSTPLPKTVKRKVKGEIIESKFLLSESPIKKRTKLRLNGRSAKSLHVDSFKTSKRKEEKKAVKATSSQKSSRVSNKRGSKSLTSVKAEKRRAVSLDRGYNKKARTSAKNVTEDSLPETSPAKLAVSVDRGYNKKAKKSAVNITEDSLPETSSANLASTSRGRRKLYSADSWLHSFTIMQQESPIS